MQKKIFILLPPSERKKEGGEIKYKKIKEKNSFKQIHKKREILYKKIINELKENLEVLNLEKIFEAKGNYIDRALFLLKTLNEQKTMPAIERYKGVMFKAINYNSLDELSKQRFNQRVLFIDSLFGILRAEDLIPNYKFPISTKFKELNPQLFWKKELKDLFEDLFKNSIIIDILPKAHKNFLTIPKTSKYYEISFYENKNGKITITGHASKKLKGELIRYLSSKEDISYGDLINFKHSQGHKYSQSLSTKNSIIYFRE